MIKQQNKMSKNKIQKQEIYIKTVETLNILNCQNVKM